MSIEEKLLQGSLSGGFLRVLYEEYLEDRVGGKVLPAVLSGLHNSGRVDVVGEFKKLTKRDFDSDFFSLRNLFGDALPDISAPVDAVIGCIRHLALESGDDMGSHVLIDSFIKFCESHESRPDELLTIALNDSNDGIDFISPAIISGAKIDLEKYTERAIKISFGDVECDALRAVFALGRIDYKGDDLLIRKAFEVVASSVFKFESDYAISIALRTLYLLASKCESLEEGLHDFIEESCSSPGEKVVHSASEILCFHRREIPVKTKYSLYDIAKNVDAKNTATINNIDYALEDLVKEGSAHKAIEIAEEIFELSDFEVKIGSFDSFERSLLDGASKEHLSNTVTRWLLSGVVSYGRFCLDLLKNTDDKGVDIRCDLSLLTGELNCTHLFVARKACGWFFMRPLSAASFILSLVDTCPDDQLGEIENVMFHPLLISYPGSVKRYLEESSGDSSSRRASFCSALLGRLEAYHNGLKPAFDVKELKPSEDHRFSYRRSHHLKMQEVMKEARKGSLTSLLGVQESVILYGNKSIHYINHGEEKTRQEIPLQSFLHSIEFPSLQHIDPHSLDSQLRFFRLEGCNR